MWRRARRARRTRWARSALAGVLLGAPIGIAAQAPGRLELTVGARWSGLETGLPAAPERLRGTGLAAGLRLRIWRVTLDTRYGQATVREAGGAPGLEVVEGAASLGIQPVRWIRLEGGPQVRAYVRPNATERWILWTGGLATKWRIVGDGLATYLTVWRVLAADVNTSAARAEGYGLDGGLMARLPRVPLGVRVGYRTDRLRLDDGSRRETMQYVFMDVSVVVR